MLNQIKHETENPYAPHNEDSVWILCGDLEAHFADKDIRHVLNLIETIDAEENMTLPHYGSLSIVGDRYWFTLSGYSVAPGIPIAELVSRLKILSMDIQGGTILGGSY